MEWLEGSAAQLRLMTTAIVHTEPELFAVSQYPAPIQSRVVVEYVIGPKDKRVLRFVEPPVVTNRIFRLCRLLFDTNRFRDDTSLLQKVTQAIVPASRTSMLVRVEIYPPSAHEQAESFLLMLEWLEGEIQKGTVSETDKRQLLGLE